VEEMILIIVLFFLLWNQCYSYFALVNFMQVWS